MVETAAHLVDYVIPPVPARQWVIAFPIPLRLLFAAHPELLTPVLQVVHRVISTFLIQQAGLKRAEATTGAVTLIQRFGSAANLKIHSHCLVLDGVYCTTGEAPVFHPEQGFSLHAEVRLAINQRHELEHLCRYITRPAIANERLQRNCEGQVVLQLKSPYHDGTTHIVMEPLEFVASASPRSCPVPGCISSASMAC